MFNGPAFIRAKGAAEIGDGERVLTDPRGVTQWPAAGRSPASYAEPRQEVSTGEGNGSRAGGARPTGTTSLTREPATATTATARPSSTSAVTGPGTGIAPNTLSIWRPGRGKAKHGRPASRARQCQTRHPPMSRRRAVGQTREERNAPARTPGRRGPATLQPRSRRQRATAPNCLREGVPGLVDFR